jgi:hypothetical protein
MSARAFWIVIFISTGSLEFGHAGLVLLYRAVWGEPLRPFPFGARVEAGVGSFGWTRSENPVQVQASLTV